MKYVFPLLAVLLLSVAACQPTEAQPTAVAAVQPHKTHIPKKHKVVKVAPKEDPCTQVPSPSPNFIGPMPIDCN